MGTITIESSKVDGLYFINELARRLNLKTKIETDVTETSSDRLATVVNYEDTPEGIVEGIQQGLKEVELAREGKIKLKTLDELLDEYKD